MITISFLQKWHKLLNLRELCRLSGLKYDALTAKIRRGSPLNEREITILSKIIKEMASDL